ncbi:MAG: hypothetical protein ACRYG7_47925 [Janthinobacterium lividum]
MNRQEIITYLKVVLRNDINGNIGAFSLRNVLSKVIEDIRAIPIAESEEAFLQERNKVVASLQQVKSHEVEVAVRSEHANKSRKTHEKYVIALSDYNQATAAIERPLGDFIDVMERLEESNK